MSLSKKVLEKYSKDFIREEYETKRKSYRQITREYGINGRTIKKLLCHYGIPVRDRSESVKTQWEGSKGKWRRKVFKENRKYRTKTSDGYYAIVYEGEHKSKDKGRVKEHIVVAERKYGRKVKKGEVVHHIDGNKLNNSPENLMIMKHSEHNKLHYKELAIGKDGRFIGKAITN